VNWPKNFEESREQVRRLSENALPCLRKIYLGKELTWENPAPEPLGENQSIRFPG